MCHPQTRLVLLLALSGCDARFTYQSLADDHEAPDLSSPAQPDLAGVDLTGVDLASADLSEGERIVSAGTFQGRAGHFGQGGASLVRRGSVQELAFDNAFQVSGVPGPVVFLTSRSDMGTKIDTTADLELGRLKSTSGVQRYTLPNEDLSGRPYVFVFCKPFSVEVARAALEAPR